jgi:hypothetical protein
MRRNRLNRRGSRPNKRENWLSKRGDSLKERRLRGIMKTEMSRLSRIIK